MKTSNIHEEYFQYHEEYQKKYGSKCVILMQVGSFHEMYGTDTRGPNLFKISELLNIVCTRKDKSNNIIDEKNPYMLGFPSVSTSKFIKILVDNNFTVVVIDQFKTSKQITRDITGIYSPSTYIDNACSDNKYLMSMFIETNICLSTSKNTMSIGMSAVDSTTGDVFFYETYCSDNINNEDTQGFEEAQRFYHHYRPVELIIYHNDNTSNTTLEKTEALNNKIKDKLDLLPNQILFMYNGIRPEFSKLTWQNSSLKKIYPYNSVETPIEYLDLVKYPYSIIALLISFDYLFQHNKKLTEQLKYPQYFNKCSHMVLGNNAQYQLNIIDYYNWENINTKFQSVNSVVNNCVTAMGKRKVKNLLCAPYTNRELIQESYDMTDCMLNNNLYDDVRTHLKCICDLDKLFRKLSIKYIQPYELYSIYESLQTLSELINFTKSNKDLKKYMKKFLNKQDFIDINSCIEFIDSKFHIEKLKLSNLIEVKESYYKNKVYKELDNITKSISSNINIVDDIAKIVEGIDNTLTVSIKNNGRDGYYLMTTKIKAKKLQEKIKDIKNKDFDLSKLVFTYQTNTCKITCDQINTNSNNIEELYVELNEKIKTFFINDMQEWYNKYSHVFPKLLSFITQFDVISNNAWTSVQYHYVKPTICDENESGSFVNGSNIRHVIVERIIDSEYVPNDISIGNDNNNAMIIFGYNSSGKSVYMKSVGVNLILAQIGYYVAAESFNYSIFDSLYTRISGGDNMLKSQSSFVVEMNELRCILKRATNKTLVIADELLNSTEFVSQISIVSSSIIKLVNLNAKFIFTSHLHELTNNKRIKDLNSVKFYHLAVSQKDDDLVFDRKLVEGLLSEKIYGINIAKYILDDPIFINETINIKNEILENSNTMNIRTNLTSSKKSNYNNDMYVDECHVCNSNVKLETHHILMQKDFDKNGVNKTKKHITKDSKANLIVLCSSCHDDVHSGKLTINSKIKSTRGYSLTN